MAEVQDIVKESILRDVSDGVISISFDGVIGYVNPSAYRILGKEQGSLEAKNFASCFFEYEENDGFNQAVMNAIYDKSNSHETLTEFFDGKSLKQLHMTTSFLMEGEKRIGLVASFRDITELAELRNAIKAMEKIKALNDTLELRNKLLSETFGRFLSDDIVRELLDTPGGLELGGKKREITIMMSDLRGFTAMSERMEADRLISMLNHYFEKMNDCIFKYDGTVIEFLGDGIFVIFGAPKENRNHASDAVACAIEMERVMEDVNSWNIQHGFPELEMGIGINSGPTIVGNIGSMKRTKYGAIGSNCNLCGRVESYTSGGEIIISSHTKDAISTDITVEDELSVLPKGADKPVTIYKISAIGAPYNLSYSIKLVEPKPLLEAKEVNILLLQGKHVGDTVNVGRLISLSSTGAFLETSLELKRYDNIQIIDNGKTALWNFEGKLFAKVTGIKDNYYELRFTSKPDGFEKAFETIF